MAKFLFIVPPLVGHVNPTLGLGTGLLNNGHEVAWLGFDPELQNRIPEGGSFHLLQSDISEAEKEKIKEEITNLSKRTVYGLDSLKFLYEDMLIPMNMGMLEGIRKEIEKYKPDVIINDQQIFAGAVAAIQHNIPYATSVTAPAAIKVNEALPRVYEWEGGQIVAFQKKAGLEGDKRLDCSHTLSLVYTSRTFFGDADLPDYFKFIGPVINRNDITDNFNWEKFEGLGDYPKILVSIGTTFDHQQKKQFFQKIVEAFEKEKLGVVVISDPTLFEYIPDNFIVCKQIPQLQIIPHIDAVVCHGGHNTICETLSYGKPSVVLPIAYDQSYVAGCVVNSGAGIRLNFNRFRPTNLKEAVARVLNETQYGDNAKKIQKSFEEAGGVNKAVEYLEQLLVKP